MSSKILLVCSCMKTTHYLLVLAMKNQNFIVTDYFFMHRIAHKRRIFWPKTNEQRRMSGIWIQLEHFKMLRLPFIEPIWSWRAYDWLSQMLWRTEKGGGRGKFELGHGLRMSSLPFWGDDFLWDVNRCQRPPLNF